MSRRWLLFFLIFHLGKLEIHAEILRPLHTRNGLDRPIEEDTVRVKTAQIVVLDRRLLIHDFPALENYSDDQLKAFLLKHFAYMSLPQAGQSIVNSPVEIDREDRRPALRPDYYRRSLVFEELDGLFDLKGAGSLRPQLHDHFYTHRNGLFSLANALREYMVERKIQELLEHSGSRFRTVSSYAVISWGFDIKDRGLILPAGGLLRQGHTRHPSASLQGIISKNHFLPKDISQEIESILRPYGMSSEHPSDETPRTLIDIQGTRFHDLIDFETYFFQDHFAAVSYWYPERKMERATPLFTSENSPRFNRNIFTPDSVLYDGPMPQLDASFRQSETWALGHARGTMTEKQIARAMEIELAKRIPSPEFKGWACSSALKEIVVGKKTR